MTDTPATTRLCKSCDTEKSFDEFRALGEYRNRKCRDCEREVNRQYMRAYRKQRTADRRAERLATLAAQPNGRPTYQQRLDALEAQVQSLLAFALLHGYNSTET